MSNAIHEQHIELKRRDGIEQHRVAVHVDLADIARRYGPRAAAAITGRVRLLEGAVIIEKLEPEQMNFPPEPIETLDQYHAYIAEASTLVALDPPPETPEGRRLMALVDVIEVFERKEWASMFPEPARECAPGE